MQLTKFKNAKRDHLPQIFSPNFNLYAYKMKWQWVGFLLKARYVYRKCTLSIKYAIWHPANWIQHANVDFSSDASDLLSSELGKAFTVPRSFAKRIFSLDDTCMLKVIKSVAV